MFKYSLDPTTMLVRSLKHEQQQHTKSIVAVVLYFLCIRWQLHQRPRQGTCTEDTSRSHTRLEKDIALRPDRPCPDVHPPANLAPNAMTTPPMKACTAGIEVSAEE